ncbi:MAG: hypothetical protein FJ241_10625 [Nitrospira sp.]|nr:hypothetical protein [Nitrospira sp.]
MNEKVRECNCKDWQENIAKLNSGFTLSTIHGLGGYQGKIFNFCPWCGKSIAIKEAMEKGREGREE